MRDSVIGEDPRQHAAPGAVHRIYCKLESGFGDEIEVGEMADGLYVGVLEVHFFDCCLVAVRLCSRVQLSFNAIDDLRSGRPPKSALELYAIPIPGIVARSDDDATCR